MPKTVRGRHSLQQFMPNTADLITNLLIPKVLFLAGYICVCVCVYLFKTRLEIPVKICMVPKPRSGPDPRTRPSLTVTIATQLLIAKRRQTQENQKQKKAQESARSCKVPLRILTYGYHLPNLPSPRLIIHPAIVST